MNNYITWGDFKGFSSIKLVNPPLDKPIHLSIDSRTIRPGDTFLALRGPNYDGHHFVGDAILKGAIGIIVEKEWANQNLGNFKTGIAIVINSYTFLANFSHHILQKLSPAIIAITGTNGKTTVKNLLAEFLSSKATTHASIGNYNNSIGLPYSIFAMPKDAKFIVLEMGADEPGDIANLCNIVRPKYGIITNIGVAHLDGFNNKKTIAETKSALFSNLPEDGIAFVNIDDPFIQKFHSHARKIRYSFEIDSENQAMDLEFDNSGKAKFHLNGIKYSMSVPGNGFARSALAAIVVALEFGITPYEIDKKLKSFKSKEGRMEQINIRGITIFNDSYNANPNSVRNSIETIGKIDCSGKRILVFGDMLELGKNAKTYHVAIAGLLEENGFSVLFTIGELAKVISDSARHIATCQHFKQHKELIIQLLKTIESGDIVLVKGSRKMHLESIVAELIAA